MSKSAGKKPKEKSDKTKADNFIWSDDEVHSCVRHLGNALDKTDWR